MKAEELIDIGLDLEGDENCSAELAKRLARMLQVAINTLEEKKCIYALGDIEKIAEEK